MDGFSFVFTLDSELGKKYGLKCVEAEHGNVYYGTVPDSARKLFQKKRKTGKNRIVLPSDFVVLDLETTGLSPLYDNIIEVAILKVRDCKVAETYSSLINPERELDDFTTELTGITDKMLKNAPVFKDVAKEIRCFIGDDVVVGQKTSFDINFLYDNFLAVFNEDFQNDFVSIERIAKKVIPGQPHYRLSDIAAMLNIEQANAHMAFADCETTLNCYLSLRKMVLDGIGEDKLRHLFQHRYCIESIKTDKTEFDENHPLFGKHCTFTGVLERMPRKTAAQIVVDLGGFCDDTVTKVTNFLILGNNDYCTTLRDGKSNKQKKAEAYKLKGRDIEIIPESVFYELISDTPEECK